MEHGGSLFSWNKDGQSLRIGLLLAYSNITFYIGRKTDAGNYTVSATNFVLGSPIEHIGSDTGSFYLDVICKLCIISTQEEI